MDATRHHFAAERGAERSKQRGVAVGARRLHQHARAEAMDRARAGVARVNLRKHERHTEAFLNLIDEGTIFLQPKAWPLRKGHVIPKLFQLRGMEHRLN